jgi:hypothetical protein
VFDCGALLPFRNNFAEGIPVRIGALANLEHLIEIAQKHGNSGQTIGGPAGEDDSAVEISHQHGIRRLLQNGPREFRGGNDFFVSPLLA